jgi:replicative DNA helicase
METKNNFKPKQHIVFADYGKVPPQNIEYEELLLSILITMNDYISYVSYFLKTHHFYKESNQLIYEIILQQHAKNFPFGTVEIATVARETNVLENIGGVVYINKIAQLSLNAKSSQLQYYAMHLIEKYILRSFIQINHKSTQDSYNNVDPFTIAEYVQKETTKLFSEVEILRMKELKKSFNSTIDSIIDNHTNEDKTTKLFYSTGMPLIDEIALFRPNNCMILAGKSGSGKTRLLISLMRILLLKHDDISVRWYSMEDDMSKLIKCILSPIVGLTDNQLSGINYTMTTEEINKLKEYQNAFSKLDVEIIENSRSISQIAIEYKTFVNDRKDKMNFLIIDNLMLLNENSYVGGKLEVDDTITKELINLRKYCNDNNINSYIIAIHHFNDEQIKKDNLKTAYRPIESNIKGSSRFRDAFTQVVLLNAINNYPDLLEEFPEEKEILEDLYIFDLTKYRDGSKAIIRFFGNPEYSEFVYANGNVYGKSNSKKFKKKK